MGRESRVKRDEPKITKHQTAIDYAKAHHEVTLQNVHTRHAQELQAQQGCIVAKIEQS